MRRQRMHGGTCKRSITRFALAIVFILAANATRAQAPAEDRYAEARKFADQQAKEWLQRGIAGLSLTVAVEGKIVYSEGFGFADLEERVPAWPTTKFRIGSISKPLTAVGLMELVEAGKVDLDAPVQNYVPSFPDKGTPITVRMVAGHLAGIRHYNGDEFLIQKHYDSVLDGLKIFEHDPLVSAPGTEFHYSSYGFNLLSAVIESASGEKFLDYMQKHVFDAIGLAHSTADQNARIVEERSRFYEKEKDGTLENAPYVDNSYKWAGGGFLSTSEDLVRFGSAMLRPGVLNEAALKEMFTAQHTSTGKPIEYGIGWFVGKSQSGKPIYAHSGGSVGGTSQLILYPETHVVVALVTNMSNGDWKREEVEALAERFVERQK